MMTTETASAGPVPAAVGRRIVHLRRLALFGSLVAILVACCPVPAGTATDTSFAAELQIMTEEGAFALTDDGHRVHLTFAEPHPGQEFAIGQRVYVEGFLIGEDVQVRRMILI